MQKLASVVQNSSELVNISSLDGRMIFLNETGSKILGISQLEHHERMDDSGYPHGLTGDKLLMESRILAVADVVEAIASHRPYRASLGLGAALEEITCNRGTLYDPEAVDACLRLFNKMGYQLAD